LKSSVIDKKSEAKLWASLNSSFDTSHAVNVNTTKAVVNSINNCTTKVKITSKHKQSAQIEAERVFNCIASKCDKKPNGFIKKIKALK
jgi:hypothetical protein